MELRAIAEKWNYKTERRYENKAGYEPITEKQMNYIRNLAAQKPEPFSELDKLISGYWNVSDISEWTKADGMFVINSLQR